MKKKRIAFIFALPIRTNPILITMPFGHNVIQLLDEAGYEIDVYLSEYKSNAYNKIFSSSVSVHFLDKNYLWPREGFASYLSLTNYFRWISSTKLRGKYSHIFASGMAGVTLGKILKSSNGNAKFIYLNDEFPVQGQKTIWVKSEIKSARNTDIVITPDEERFPPLAKQIPALNSKPHYTLPNAPLKKDIGELPRIDWHSYFKIDPSKKLFLMAGGLQDFNLIEELLKSVKGWPENTVLILKGKNNIEGFREKYAHLDIPGKIIWTAESFSPDKLHSLIAYVTASLCLYRPINDNLHYVGKSSGKLMRSVLLGKPVIATHSAMSFVSELDLGCLVENEKDIIAAIQNISKNGELLEENCKQNYDQISFEKYWSIIEKELDL